MKIKISILLLLLIHISSIGQDTLIYTSDYWKYFDRGNVNNSNWNATSFNDFQWKSGYSQFGYGEGDENTLVDFGFDSNLKHQTTYFRKSINTTLANNLTGRILADDGAVIYINGVEVYRYNMPNGPISYETLASSSGDEGIYQSFTIPNSLVVSGSNTIAVEVHQVNRSSGDLSFDLELIDNNVAFVPPSSKIYINEIVASNSESAISPNGESYDWIELYNGNSFAVDLEGYFVSDDSNDLEKYEIETSLVIPAYSYQVLWASDDVSIGSNHLPFKLSSEGEFVALTKPDGSTIEDSVTFGRQITDLAFGRVETGASDWAYLSPSTFMSTNSISQQFSEILDPPVFSNEGGFYNQNFSLIISHSDPNATLLYTLDGSEVQPFRLSPESYQYKNNYNSSSFLTRSNETKEFLNPILIQNRTSQANGISQISTGDKHTSTSTYFPNYLLYKGSPVRARAYKPGAYPSEEIVNTYFINSNGANPYGIPVVSINTDERNFFDYNLGIMVQGDNPPNFTLDNEVPVHFEYLKLNNPVVKSHLGARIHGSSSANFPLQSLRMYARDTYGKGEIEYPFFGQNNGEIFKRFILRNSGNDFNLKQGTNKSTMLKDGSIQAVLAGMNISTQAYQPTVGFINGEFWGVWNLRERYDKFYLKYKYGIDENNIDLLKNNDEVQEGSRDDYNDMLAFFNSNNDFGTNSNRYDWAKTQIDLESYADYQIAQIFFHNQDWPQNNVMYWKQNIPYNPSATVGKDGRWRWLIFDLDYTCLNLSNALPSARNKQVIFDRLLDSPVFSKYYINRYADLLNSRFKPSHFNSIIDSLSQQIDIAIDHHIDRWQTMADKTEWITSVNNLKVFVSDKHNLERNYIKSAFNISGLFNLNIDVSDQDHGFIKVNTIDITPSTPGINNNPFPWSGVYFDNVSISITAKPKKGYKFLHWVHNNTILTDSVLTITTSIDVNYTAIFEEHLLTTNPLIKAFELADCFYSFESWAPSNIEGSQPTSAKFVFMNEEDPGENAYIAGFTSGEFDHLSKTRVNGLGSNGVSFINTGSGQNGYPQTKLGGMLLALNTTGMDSVSLTFKAGTVKANSREYNIKLFARVGDIQSFVPLLNSDNQEVVYPRNGVDGHEKEFVIGLPSNLVDQPYIQLFWKYYYTGVRNNPSSGARDGLRLDDIFIKSIKSYNSPEIVSQSMERFSEFIMANIVQPNANIELKAFNSFELIPGFKVENTVFKVEVEQCSN